MFLHVINVMVDWGKKAFKKYLQGQGKYRGMSHPVTLLPLSLTSPHPEVFNTLSGAEHMNLWPLGHSYSTPTKIFTLNSYSRKCIGYYLNFIRMYKIHIFFYNFYKAFWLVCELNSMSVGSVGIWNWTLTDQNWMLN